MWDSKHRAITQTMHTNVVGLFCDAGWPDIKEQRKKNNAVSGLRTM